MVSLNDGVRVRSGEIAFYILAGTMALIVAMQPWSLLAATLFVTAVALAVELEG
jgi:hypothetical protein